MSTLLQFELVLIPGLISEYIGLNHMREGDWTSHQLYKQKPRKSRCKYVHMDATLDIQIFPILCRKDRQSTAHRCPEGIIWKTVQKEKASRLKVKRGWQQQARHRKKVSSLLTASTKWTSESYNIPRHSCTEGIRTVGRSTSSLLDLWSGSVRVRASWHGHECSKDLATALLRTDRLFTE